MKTKRVWEKLKPTLGGWDSCYNTFFSQTHLVSANSHLMFIAWSCASNLRLYLFFFSYAFSNSFFFSPSPSTGLVDNRRVPHQRGHSLPDEDDHVHARSRPQEAEEGLDGEVGGGGGGGVPVRPPPRLPATRRHRTIQTEAAPLLTLLLLLPTLLF